MKFELYQNGGVEHYWIVDPTQRRFEAFSVVDGKYVKQAGGTHDDGVAAPPFGALAIPLGQLWMD